MFVDQVHLGSYRDSDFDCSKWRIRCPIEKHNFQSELPRENPSLRARPSLDLVINTDDVRQK